MTEPFNNEGRSAFPLQGDGGLKKYAIIVAGGIGRRMGALVPKQFLLLRGKPVLWHTLQVFLDAYEELEIILVLPEEYMETGRTMVNAMRAPHRIRMVAGGGTRFHSVQNGLRLIGEPSGGKALGELSMGEEPIEDGPRNGASSEGEPSVIFVHDGVRCLLTSELIHHCYEEARRFGSAIPVVDPKDSLRLVTETGSEGIERSRVKCVQTPQTFLSALILPAYAAGYEERFTDEATVVEACSGQVHLVHGETANIKITTPEDLILAEDILRRRAQRDAG